MDEKKKFGIRKFKVGVASIAIASFTTLSVAPLANAEEVKPAAEEKTAEQKANEDSMKNQDVSRINDALKALNENDTPENRKRAEDVLKIAPEDTKAHFQQQHKALVEQKDKEQQQKALTKRSQSIEYQDAFTLINASTYLTKEQKLQFEADLRDLNKNVADVAKAAAQANEEAYKKTLDDNKKREQAEKEYYEQLDRSFHETLGLYYTDPNSNIENAINQLIAKFPADRQAQYKEILAKTKEGIQKQKDRAEYGKNLKAVEEAIAKLQKEYNDENRQAAERAVDKLPESVRQAYKNQIAEIVRHNFLKDQTRRTQAAIDAIEALRKNDTIANRRAAQKAVNLAPKEERDELNKKLDALIAELNKKHPQKPEEPKQPDTPKKEDPKKPDQPKPEEPKKPEPKDPQKPDQPKKEDPKKPEPKDPKQPEDPKKPQDKPNTKTPDDKGKDQQKPGDQPNTKAPDDKGKGQQKPGDQPNTKTPDNKGKDNGQQGQKQQTPDQTKPGQTNKAKTPDNKTTKPNVQKPGENGVTKPENKAKQGTLPETGEVGSEQMTTIFGGVSLFMGAMLLFSRRKKESK